MGVEVDGFEMVQGPIVEENSVLHSKENGKLNHVNGSKEPIKFGTHGDEPVIKEENDDSVANLPKNAVDEWPAARQIHCFYFVRHRSYDDPSIKTKIDLADREIQKRNQSRFQILEALKAKRSERSELISQIKSLKDDNRQIRTIFDDKRKEIEPLQHALGKLRDASNTGRGSGLCSSEEELNSYIHSLQYRMQHESIPLSEEKQIIKEIKQLEGTREKVIANAAVRAKVQDSIVHKEALQDQVKVIGGDLDGVRKQQQEVRGKIKQLDDALKVIDGDIKSLQDELTAVTEKRENHYESIHHLRKKREDTNSNFYQSRKILNKARELAANKDIKGIEELSYSEDEKFMALWNNDKAFREDYELKLLPSLDSRQLSRDGRMRNPDEKPLIMVESSPIAPSATESVVKAIPKRTKEDSKSIQLNNAAEPIQKVEKDVKNKGDESKSSLEKIEKEDSEIFVLEKPKTEAVPPKIEIDPAKLKEMKREEEIAKAKQALERKKKLSEKSAAKAAIRAQKDEEKKLKEREKKAKKKSAPSGGPAGDSEEPAEETTEPEKEIEKIESPVPAAEKIRKNSTVRVKNRSKGLNAIAPRIIPKAIRKKSANYWQWVVPSAVLFIAIMAVLGYNYFLVN